MLRSIIDVAITAFIILGSIAVVYIVYTHLHTAINDPSVPHDTLWRVLFG